MSKEFVGEVTSTFDKSVIRKSFTTKKEADRLMKEASKEKKDLIGHNDVSKLGLESSLGRDERKFALKAAFDNKKVVSVSSGIPFTGVGYNTTLQYAKELRLPLFDDRKKEWLKFS